MNWFWIIAGFFIVFSGFIHMILGEKWIFNQLNAENMVTHYTGEITKITVRWFWHVGSFLIFLNASIVLTMGFTDGFIPEENFVAKLVAIIYAGFIGTLIIVNRKNLGNLRQFPQAILFIIFIALLLLGSS